MAGSQQRYTVHIGVIDQQHGELLRLIEELRAAKNLGWDLEDISRLAGKLTEAAIIHFATEEKLLGDYGYPGLSKQKKEHDGARAELLKLKEKWAGSPLEWGEKMVEFLDRWLIEHMEGADLAYAEFLKDQGAR